jgi:hypothetical protein
VSSSLCIRKKSPPARAEAFPCYSLRARFLPIDPLHQRCIREQVDLLSINLAAAEAHDARGPTLANVAHSPLLLLLVARLRGAGGQRFGRDDHDR